MILRFAPLIDSQGIATHTEDYTWIDFHGPGVDAPLDFRRRMTKSRLQSRKITLIQTKRPSFQNTPHDFARSGFG